MLITIYNRLGNLKTELSPNDSSTQVKEVQGDNVLTLSFTHYDHIELDVDDYIDFEGERFWLTEKYRPKQNSRKEWVYDVKLYGVESMLKRLLVIKSVDGEDDPVFTLTAPPHEHVALIVNCMNNGLGNITDWKVGTVVGTENIVIDYFGKYCDEALKEIAEKVGAEAWVDGDTVNICKCEHGEPLPMGYQKGLLSIDPGTADNVKFYTRLYPVGSSRNIDREKYGFTRLQLPGGQKFVEINADKYGRVDHYEQDSFADIYPRRIGTVSEVRSEIKPGEDGNEFTIYYFKDSALNFDPNDYEIGGLVKRVSFQEGSELAGLGDEENGTYYFEVNFNSSTQEFEIITIWPYGDDMQLPGDKLVPKAGDKYILWNISMPDEYYGLAEAEFLEAVEQYNADHNLDIAVYKAPTDHVWIEDNDVKLTIGQRIRLESEEYFPGIGYRDSRITKITRKVNLPSYMDIEISDALSKTRLEKVSDAIEDVRSYAKSLAETISLPDIIKTGDRTRWTDNNLLSAARSAAEFLSKLKDDVAKGRITFEQGAEFGDFISGFAGSGAKIDANGYGEFQGLKVNGFLEVLELIINRISAIEGDQLLTEADTIESIVENADGTYDLYLHSKYDGYFTAQKEGNVVKGIYNTLDQGGGSYYTSWMRINTVNTAQNRVNVSIYDDEDVPGGKNFAPIEMMRFARWGNQTDKSRQSCLYLSSTEGRIVKLTGVTKPIIDETNYGATFGTVPDFLKSMGLPLREDQDYIYGRGIVVQDFIQVDYKGRPVPTIVDRGAWIAGETYYFEEKNPDTGILETSDVWHYGCRWRCMKKGTMQEPRWNAIDWAFIEGNPDFTVEFEPVNTIFRVNNIDMTLSIVAWMHNRDITADILDADVVWTRYSEDADGYPRPASDNIWALNHAGAGKSIHITTVDIDYNGRIPKKVRFTATVTLRDGVEAVAALSLIDIN